MTKMTRDICDAQRFSGQDTRLRRVNHFAGPHPSSMVSGIFYFAATANSLNDFHGFTYLEIQFYFAGNI